VSDQDALQAALAAEQAIVYGYGVLGAHLSGADQQLAGASLQVHQERRDAIAALITGAGATPSPAAAAYGLPFPVTGAGTARRLAVQLETSGAGAAWDLVSAAAPGSAARGVGIEWLADAAARVQRWGGAVPALPGQPS